MHQLALNLWRILLSLRLAVVALLAPLATVQQVMLLTLDGAIGPANADYVARSTAISAM